MTWRAGTLEYMAPEVLDKPTVEEVFHEVSNCFHDVFVCCMR